MIQIGTLCCKFINFHPKKCNFLTPNLYVVPPNINRKKSKGIKLEFKEIKGHSNNIYKFVKIGEAYLDDTPLKATFNGKELKDWRLKLRLLVSDEILDAEQSCYLVFEEDTLIYVGYYSNSFRDRWWKKTGYFWHGDIVDNGVNKILQNDSTKSVSVWISINPYAVRDNHKINISKFIEDDIIMATPESQLLNKVGTSLKMQKEHVKPVSQILNIDNTK